MFDSESMTHTINVITANVQVTIHIPLMCSENVCIIPNQEQCKDTAPTYWQVYGQAHICDDAVPHNGTMIVNNQKQRQRGLHKDKDLCIIQQKSGQN